jgi:zinc transporter ZupT
LNALVTHFLHGHHHHHPDPSPSPGTNNRGNSHHPVTTTAVGEITDGIATRKPPSPRVTTTPTRTPPITNSNNDSIQSSSQQVPPTQQDRPNICYSSDDPVRGLEVLQQMADILVAEHELRERSQMPVGLPSPAQNVTVVSPPNENVDNIETLVELSPLDESTNRNVITVEDGAATNESQVEDDEDVTTHQQQENDAHERQLLFRMSMNTAIAIGLHNFPEGLATFVATLNDPSVGFVLAVAIAIHNIPEGLCVALPVYYATGSRTKAFGWAIFSGLSEPLAAVFGYIILANAVGSTTYGILFGIISGMMVIISTRELLPTAHRYDPTDRVVTYSFIFGMAVLALSLVLFVL